MLGVGNLFWVPLMRVIGKRPVFLIAIALLAVFNVWSFKATTYRSLWQLACSQGSLQRPAMPRYLQLWLTCFSYMNVASL